MRWPIEWLPFEPDRLMSHRGWPLWVCWACRKLRALGLCWTAGGSSMVRMDLWILFGMRRAWGVLRSSWSLDGCDSSARQWSIPNGSALRGGKRDWGCRALVSWSWNPPDTCRTIGTSTRRRCHHSAIEVVPSVDILWQVDIRFLQGTWGDLPEVLLQWLQTDHLLIYVETNLTFFWRLGLK